MMLFQSVYQIIITIENSLILQVPLRFISIFCIRPYLEYMSKIELAITLFNSQVVNIVVK